MVFCVGMVRQLKGAPLAVLVVLSYAGQRVSQDYLERCSGYSDKPVSQALEYLRDLGVVDRSAAGWGLCEGQQLVLGQPAQLTMGEVVETDAAGQSVGQESAVGSEAAVEVIEADFEPDNSDCSGGSRKVSDSPLKKEVLINLNIKESSSSLTLKGAESEFFRLVGLLVRSGVYESVARELAGQVGVGFGQLRAWVFEQSLEPKYTPGLLAYWLRHRRGGVGEALRWDAAMWGRWLRANGIEGDVFLAVDLERDYPDPAEAFDKLPDVVDLAALEAGLWLHD